MFKSDGALFVGQRDIGFDAPGPPLGRVADTSRVVLRQTRTKILRLPDVEPIVIRIALQNINVCKCTHVMACRVEARCVCVARLKESAFAKAPSRQSTLSATAASVDWRQGDSNP